MWGVLPSPKTGRLTNNRKLLVLGPVVTCAVVHGFPSGPTSQAPGGPRRNFMSWSRRHRPCEILRCPTQSHRACSLLTSLHRFSSTHTQPPNTYHAQSKKQDPNLKKKHIIHLGVRFLPPPPPFPKTPRPRDRSVSPFPSPTSEVQKSAKTCAESCPEVTKTAWTRRPTVMSADVGGPTTTHRRPEGDGP